MKVLEIVGQGLRVEASWSQSGKHVRLGVTSDHRFWSAALLTPDQGRRLGDVLAEPGAADLSLGAGLAEVDARWRKHGRHVELEIRPLRWWSGGGVVESEERGSCPTDANLVRLTAADATRLAAYLRLGSATTHAV